MTQQLKGASVVVETERFEVDLQALAQRTGLANKKPELPSSLKSLQEGGAPPVTLQGMRDVHVETGGLSLQEILRAADSGKATVRIPLVPQSVKIGPFSVDIEAGARIVLDLVVNPGGLIERKETRGRLEPALKLPLGVVVHGVYVDAHGNIVADVERLPDVNLSLLALRGLRVPESLSALLDLAFAPKKEEKKADDAAPQNELIDFAGIEVDASDVKAGKGAIALGAGLVITSGDNTRLDITWARGRLTLKGVVDVVDASVRQAAFVIEGVVGSGRVDFSVDVDSGAFAVAVDDANARVARAHAHVGDSVVEVKDAGTSSAARLRIEKSGANDTPLVFSAELPAVDGRLHGGTIVVDVGPRRVPFVLKPGKARGAVAVSNKHHRVDVVVEDVGLVVDDVAFDAPLVQLHVQQAAARATGRLRAATDLGLAFSGAVHVDAVLDDALVNAGPVVARGGGSAHVVVDDVATGPHGLEVLHLKGSLDLSLQSGKVPLFSTSLEILPGAAATVVLDKVVVDADAGARVEGSVVVEAGAAPTVVDARLLTVPESACRLTVGRFVVDRSLFVAEKLHASIRTR